MGHLDDIQTALKPVKKLKLIFMTILGLGYRWINDEPARPDPTVTHLMAHVSESIKDREVKFWHNLHSGLRFVPLRFEIDIFDSLDTMRFSVT